METAISFENNKYYQTALGLSFLDHHKIDKPIKVPAHELLGICARAWDVEESNLSGKLKHNKNKELIKQFTLLWALSYYSDPVKETKNVIGCNYSSVCSARNVIRNRIEDTDEIKVVMAKIVQECEGLTRGAGRKALSKIIPNDINIGYTQNQAYISNNGLYSKLNIYQANKVPIRTLDWFKSNKDHLYVYHIDKATDISVCTRTYHQDQLLFISQINGYRFIKINEHKHFGLFHPVCDKCFSKNDCSRRLFGRNTTFWTDNYSCLVPAEDTIIRVDLDLLAPLKQYQLQ